LQSFNVAMQNLIYFFVVDINDQSFACKGRSSKSLSREIGKETFKVNL